MGGKRFDWRANLLTAILCGVSASAMAGDLDLFLASRGMQGAPNVVLHADGQSGPGQRSEAGLTGGSVTPPVVGLQCGPARSLEGGAVGMNVDGALLSSGSALTPQAPTETGGACVIAGTPIRMADGSFRKIEDLVPGDLIAGVDGKTNTVIEVLTWHLGISRLYGLNGTPPFMTEDHPVLTTQGWKSFNPGKSRESLEFMEFDLLTEGDDILSGLATVRLDQTLSVSAHPDTMVFLPVVSGDCTFQPYGYVTMGSIGVGHELTMDQAA